MNEADRPWKKGERELYENLKVWVDPAPMSHWNHRVLKKHYRHEVGEHVSEGDYYEIHEVYYNDKNEIDGMTENGVRPGGNNIDELKTELTQMLECLQKPILIIEGDKIVGEE